MKRSKDVSLQQIWGKLTLVSIILTEYLIEGLNNIVDISIRETGAQNLFPKLISHLEQS